jgi:Ca2+-binding RTX toxin-like protein
MVKVVFENNNINDIFNGTAELEISGNHKRATYADGITAGKLVFVGSNLVRDGDTSYLSGGTINQLLITDENNDFAFKLTGANINAADLPHNYTTGSLDHPNELLSVMLRGRDRIVGSEMHDYLHGFGGADRIKGKRDVDDIDGGAGNDVLTGGRGGDVFYFNPAKDGKDHDVITDFEAADTLWIESASVTAVDAINQGQDTRLTLDGGSTILLKDIEKQDFLDSW